MRSGGQYDAPDAAVTANQVSRNPFGVCPPFSHWLVSAVMGSFQLGRSIKIWSWLVFSGTVRHFSLLPRESAQSRTLTSRIKLLPLIWPNLFPFYRSVERSWCCVLIRSSKKVQWGLPMARPRIRMTQPPTAILSHSTTLARMEGTIIVWMDRMAALLLVSTKSVQKSAKGNKRRLVKSSQR